MKFITNIQSKLGKFSSINIASDCPVSRASVEIMLNRVCNGNVLEFPFSK